LIDWITNNSKLKSDAAIGLVFSFFFGFGLMLLSSIQQSQLGGQAGLDAFIFGSAASIIKEDLTAFYAITAIILLTLALFYKQFRLISFDPHFAKSAGLPVRMLEFLLASLTVLAVVQGIQAVGAVLMAAMLITPAAAARYWTSQLSFMLLFAALFGMGSALVGAYLSFALGIPTGPVIIVIVSTLAVLSMLLAPEKGILARKYVQWQNRRKINDENILKRFYHLGEAKGDFEASRYPKELRQHRPMRSAKLENGLKRLMRRGLLLKSGQGYKLSDSGLSEAFRIVKIHRLWELYLTRYMNIAEDQVHDDAEASEHIISPELEAILAKQLDYPLVDPHGKTIEYLKKDA
jgi:manganese/zinc/iron transport system permease protein